MTSAVTSSDVARAHLLIGPEGYATRLGQGRVDEQIVDIIETNAEGRYGRGRALHFLIAEWHYHENMRFHENSPFEADRSIEFIQNNPNDKG